MIILATVWFLSVLASGDPVAPAMVCPPSYATGNDGKCHLTRGQDHFTSELLPSCPDEHYTLNHDKTMCEVKEFTISTVYFDSASDCDAAGKTWISDLADTAYHPKRELRWHRNKIAPSGATVTYSCVERERPK